MGGINFTIFLVRNSISILFDKDCVRTRTEQFVRCSAFSYPRASHISSLFFLSLSPQFVPLHVWLEGMRGSGKLGRAIESKGDVYAHWSVNIFPSEFSYKFNKQSKTEGKAKSHASTFSYRFNAVAG